MSDLKGDLAELKKNNDELVAKRETRLIRAEADGHRASVDAGNPVDPNVIDALIARADAAASGKTADKADKTPYSYPDPVPAKK